MIVKNICIQFLLLLWAGIMFAQSNENLIIPDGNDYIYQDVVVKYNQLEEAFATKPEAFYFFDKSRRQKKSATIWGITSLTLIGGGVALASQYDGRNNDYTSLITGILMVLAAPIPGIIGIVQRSKSHKNKKRSIVVFNGMEFSLNPVQEQRPEISFGTATNGVGIQVRF